MPSSKGFLLWLAGLSVLGFLATDMYLPAFSAIEQDLRTSPGAISASLSLFLGGFALAQLAWGPLSDRFGRKPILLAGLGIFALGCLGIMMVDNVVGLLALRFVQAVGVCAAAVSWQALVTDRYPPRQARRIFATIMPLVGLSPALAPLLGSWLLLHAEWRAIFLTLFVITLVLIAPATVLKSLNTAPPSGERIRFSTLLCRRDYCGNVLIYAACSAGFFAWLTGSPFLLRELGYGPSATGLSYVPQTIAFLVGGYGYRILLSRISGERLLPWLLGIYTFSMFAIWGIAFSGHATLTLLLIPFCVMALVNGAIYPIVVASALLPFPQATGRAAALQNALQLGLCFLASIAVSCRADIPLMATTTVMASTAVIAMTGYAVRRNSSLLLTQCAQKK